MDQGQARRRPRRPRRARDRPGRGDRRDPRRADRRAARSPPSARASTRTGTASSTGPGSCSRPRSSTRTCTCARPAARTRRRSRRGTAAAAAGGYCAILAMPNTDPVVDSAATLGALVETARREAEVQVGFLAAITRGQEGAELTEMGELADAGAVALLRRRRPGRLGRADAPRAPVRVDDRTAARAPLRGADRSRAAGTCTRAASRRSSASPGIRRSAESVMVERDLVARRVTRTSRCICCTCPRPSRSRRCARARDAGVHASGEVTPHHLCLTDEAVRSLDSNVKMNPPLRAERDRAGAARGAARRDDRVHRHRPRTARAAREGGAVRGGAVRRDRARDRVRRALHAARRDRAARRSRRC